MKEPQPYMRQVADWLVILLQMIVGLTVMKTGFDLAAGKILDSVSMSSDPLTPIFIILLGAYFSFSGLFRKLLNKR